MGLPALTDKLELQFRWRYGFSLGLRLGLLAVILLFLTKDFPVYALAAAGAALALYALSLAVRTRDQRSAAALLILGDVPLLVAAVHLPSHELSFEVLVPLWLISIVLTHPHIHPAALGLFTLAGWLAVASHAYATLIPYTYLAVQTSFVLLGLFLALALRFERGRSRNDVLTGVLGRGAGLAELHHTLQQQRVRQVAFIDLRGFKGINDRYGHTVGDEVLVAVAERLRGALRRNDVLLRYGGDEFIAASGAPELEARLRQVFAQPVHVRALELAIGARIGVMAVGEGTTLEAVVHEADRRMYADGRARSPESGQAEKGA